MIADTIVSPATPMRTRDQLISTPAPVTVAAVTPANPNSFVVTGSGGAAWARKFSSDGTTLWEYLRGNGNESVSETYLDAVSMLDGSTFLCGHSIHPAGSPEPSALLTHVDAHGHQLNEIDVVPKAESGNIAHQAYFQSCARFGKQILLHGYLSRESNVAGARSPLQMHWLVAADENGKILWQREVPKADFHSFSSEADVLLPMGHEVFLSRTDNRHTEVLRFNDSGDLLGRLILTGPFHLVRSVSGEPQFVELLGSMAGKGELLRLTNDLREESRIPVSFADSLSITLAYRLRDGSLCVFGSTVHNLGQRIRPAVAHVDAQGHHAQIFEPEWQGIKNAVVNLPAAPIDSNGNFVTAVRVVHRSEVADGANESRSGNTSNSLALDYFRLQ